MRSGVITGVCMFVVIIVAGHYFLQRQPTTQDAAIAVRVADVRQAPKGWREYRNRAYRFSLLYPERLDIKEYPEGGNALTVTFQNIEKSEGFQVFIVPYEEPQISDERFKKDIPSGVRVDLVNTAVDGATGAAFYSTNAMLGETQEIWFIRNGFLFEVTAAKSLGAWLDDIIRTWKFID